MTAAALLGLATLFVIGAIYALAAALLARRFGRRALWIAFAVFTGGATALFTAGAANVPGGELDPRLATAIATLATFGVPALVVTCVLHRLVGRAERPSRRRLIGAALATLVVAVPLGAAASFAVDAASTVGAPPPAPWVRVMKNRRADVLVDTARLERTAEGTRVWIRVNQAVADTGPDRFDRVEAHEEVDCRGRRVKDLHVQVSRGDAPPLRSMDPSPQLWIPFHLHPMSETLFDATCKRLAEVGH